MRAGAGPHTTRGPRVVRAFARWLLSTEFTRTRTAGAERVPLAGPAVVVANHFGSLTDPLLLLVACPRPVGFLAKATLWTSPVLRFGLDAARAVPVHRPQDAGAEGDRGPAANRDLLRECAARLGAGEAIALFPEGVSQEQPRLMPLRTGAARIALALGRPVAIVPAGIDARPGAHGGRGEAIVRFGEPFEVDGSRPEDAGRRGVVATTRRIEAALHALLAEAPSQDDATALRTLRALFDQERRTPPAATLEEDLARTRAFADALERLRATDPAAVDDLRARVAAFLRALDLAGVSPAFLGRRYRGVGVARFLLLDLLAVLLVTPAALVALVVVGPARWLGDVLALRAYGGLEDLRTFCRMAGTAAATATLCLVLAVAGAVVFGGVGAGVGLALPPLLLRLLLAWDDRRREVLARLRAFLLLAGSPLGRELRRRRRELIERTSVVAARLSPREPATS